MISDSGRASACTNFGIFFRFSRFSPFAEEGFTCLDHSAMSKKKKFYGIVICRQAFRPCNSGGSCRGVSYSLARTIGFLCRDAVVWSEFTSLQGAIWSEFTSLQGAIYFFPWKRIHQWNPVCWMTPGPLKHLLKMTRQLFIMTTGEVKMQSPWRSLGQVKLCFELGRVKERSMRQ